MTGPTAAQPAQAGRRRGLRREPPHAIVAGLRRWWLPVLLVAAGVAIRLAQFMANRSLFIDEAAIGLNLRDRTFAELVRGPLDFAQTGPLGLLLGQKLMIGAFGDSEFALRLLPFLAAILSVPLVALLAHRTLARVPAAVVVALFAFSYPLVYFAADAKPYAVDAFATAVVLLLAMRHFEARDRGDRMFALAATGTLLLWFSQPVVFVLGALALLLLWTALRTRGRLLRVWYGTTAVVWAANALAATLLSARLLTADQRIYMKEFWAAGFLPIVPTRVLDLFWLPLAIFRVTGDVLGAAFPQIAMLVLLVLGIIYHARLRTTHAFVLLGPVLLALVASALHQYPFGGWRGVFPNRHLLFLAPCFLLLVGAGLQRSMVVLPRIAVALLIGLLIGTNAHSWRHGFPLLREELRPVLADVARSWEDGDVIYVYLHARHAFAWYEHRLGLGAVRRVYGSCAPPAMGILPRDIDRATGARRTWLLLVGHSARDSTLLVSHMQASARETGVIRAHGAMAAVYAAAITSPHAAAPAGEHYGHSPYEGIVEACSGVYEWPRSPPR